MVVPRTLGQRLQRPMVVLAGAALAATGCGLGTDDDATATSTGSEGLVESTDYQAAGKVFVSGSSTVEPISVRVAELFEDVAPNVFVDVEGPGTGDGFKKFCDGETDISDASRRIKEQEVLACQEAGIEFTEILVAIDGIAIMTNANNETIDCVSLEDLYGLVGPESNDVHSWADANEITAVGLPDVPLEIFGPGEESGTYDSFVEIVVEHIAEQRGAHGEIRSTYNPSGDDNVILAGILSSDFALGWVGFAFAEESVGVKLLEVDGGEGCVAATDQTIASSEYPVSRDLYIYVNDAKARANTGLRAFVDYYVTTGLDVAVSEVGYVELSPAAKTEARSEWGR